jgi:hypothetical protein
MSLCSALLWLGTSCSREQQQVAPVEERPALQAFTFEGSYDSSADSTARRQALYLSIDDHYRPHTDTLPGEAVRQLRVDTLRPTADGHFRWEGQTRDVAELYLQHPVGSTRHFYAAAGGHYRLTLDRHGAPTFAAEDSLNGWLHTTVEQLRSLSGDTLRTTLDSLCRVEASEVRTALLLREMVATVRDTLFLRRCLGHLTPEAKPQWLMETIDRQMDRRFETSFDGTMKRNFLLYNQKGEKVNLSTLNRSAQLYYFWADYDAPSEAPLKRMEAWHKKVGIVSICLHAADSAAWRKADVSAADHKVWLRDGLNHPLLRAWGIDRSGTFFLISPSAKLLYRGTQESELRQQIDSLPEQRVTPTRDTKAK